MTTTLICCVPTSRNDTSILIIMIYKTTRRETSRQRSVFLTSPFNNWPSMPWYLWALRRDVNKGSLRNTVLMPRLKNNSVYSYCFRKSSQSYLKIRNIYYLFIMNEASYSKWICYDQCVERAYFVTWPDTGIDCKIFWAVIGQVFEQLPDHCIQWEMY